MPSPKNTPDAPKDCRELMRYVFSPESVAVIGASRDIKKESSGGWVGRLSHFGYKGKLYPINQDASDGVG